MAQGFSGYFVLALIFSFVYDFCANTGIVAYFLAAHFRKI